MAETGMVEKVARAMFAKFWGPAAISWEKGGATHQGMMLDLARVAIEAMSARLRALPRQPACLTKGV